MTRTGRPRSSEGEGPARRRDPLSAAMGMLSRRALSEGEIRHRLSAKGFTGTASASALERLRELGLVDDRSLCMSLARSYRDVRRYGPKRIAGALRMRMFPRSLVDEAVREVSAVGEERAAAVAALRKRYRGGIPAGREAAARAFRFLFGRGFSPEVCREAIRGMSVDIEEGEG